MGEAPVEDPERSRRAEPAPSARSANQNRVSKFDDELLVPQRFDRINARGAPRRVEAGEDAGSGGEN